MSIFLSIALSSEASVLSSIVGFLRPVKQDIVVVKNSQNEALLQTLSPLGKIEKDIDITIVSESALQTETGPLGSHADLESYYPTADQISLYLVKEGDTLKTVAELFDVTVNTIVWANDITPSTKLKEGQTLLILPISGIKYEVKKSDTIQGIAKRFSADSTEILKFNGLVATSALEVGQEIIIPNGEIPEPPKPQPKKVVAQRSTTGYYIRPVTGGRKSQGLHGFNAIDIAVPVGTKIVASASGTVIVDRRGGWGGGYGTYLVISHPNGTQTLYAHNSQNLVTVGQQVKQGQLIAESGNTGRSTGPHIHFEIRGAKNPF